MGFEAYLVIAVVFGAVVLFVTDALRADLVALLALSVLLLAGVVTPSEGFLGFASPATITVAAMFVLSAGLEKTGAVSALGALLSRIARKNPKRALAALSAGTSVSSAFINNTAAVAVLLPSVMDFARETKTNPSKLLIPLSYASLFGGCCTLIGTSTNILVSALAEQNGHAPIGMFELAPLGLVLVVIGTLYMLTVGQQILPDRGGGRDFAEDFELSDYVFELRLLPECRSIGGPLGASALLNDLDLDVISLTRDDEVFDLPAARMILHEGDILRVRGARDTVHQLEQREGVQIRKKREWRDETLATVDQVELVELVVAPDSVLEGRTLKDIEFRNRFGATVLAMRHHDHLSHGEFASTPLRGGDALLVEIPNQRLAALKKDREFVVVSEHGALVVPPNPRRGLALAIVAAVVVAASTGFLNIVIAAVAGGIAMVLTRCITLEEAYGALDSRVIVLLGAILPVGLALDRTGVAAKMAETLVTVTGPLGPVAAIAGIYVMTNLMTEVMSNNATAVLLVPIAIGVADALQLDPRPFLMAVTFAASASFMTPVGYQTNTLVYGPGAYRFSDYLKVGTPLALLFGLTATLLIPIIWPF
jgi:di/tricarboxylate transporter